MPYDGSHKSADEIRTDLTTRTKDAYEDLEFMHDEDLLTHVLTGFIPQIVLVSVLYIVILRYFPPSIAGIVAGIVWITTLVRPDVYVRTVLNGRRIRPQDGVDGRLYNLFSEVCEELGYDVEKHQLFLTDTQSPAAAFTTGMNTILISEDAVEDLTRTELKAVLAHEIAHTSHTLPTKLVFVLQSAPVLLVASIALLAGLPQQTAFFIVVGYSLIKKVVGLLLVRQMELHSDRTVPEEYSYHFSSALTQIAKKTYHVSSTFQGYLYALVDPHPAINQRIENTTDITLNQPPSEDKDPLVYRLYASVFTILFTVFLAVGLYSYLGDSQLAIYTGYAVLSIVIIALTPSKLLGKDHDRSMKSNVLRATGFSVATLIYVVVAAYYSGGSLIPQANTIQGMAEIVLIQVGYLTNSILISIMSAFLVIRYVGMAIMFYSDGSELEIGSIRDDSGEEQTLREALN